MDEQKKLEEASKSLAQKFSELPEVVVVLGSGLKDFSNTLNNPQSLKTTEVPHMTASTVAGHKGEIIFGELESKKVLAVSGRLHGYEGYSPNQVVFLLRALRLWGCKRFILTNSAGSTHRAVAPGSLVLISDHINFTGQSPLKGTQLFGGERFADMSDLYSRRWRQKASEVVGSQIPETALRSGVYVGVSGPSYETAAEIRLFEKWGGDIVGMSTVWEALALKQMGAEVLGISCVSNYGTGVTDKALTHQEVLDTAKEMSQSFIKVLQCIIQEGMPS